MQKHQLIVFSRTPVPGKVKQRIARALGQNKALSIHHKLFDYTLQVVRSSGLPYKIYFSGPAATLPVDYELQHGKDLGQRMLNCFKKELKQADSVCLIGSDCLEITPVILQQAFAVLANYDVVLGPAHDGGYYLVGMKAVYPKLFTNITWGTNTVLEKTLAVCRNQGLSYALLPTLNDIDYKEDVPSSWL